MDAEPASPTDPEDDAELLEAALDRACALLAAAGVDHWEARVEALHERTFRGDAGGLRPTGGHLLRGLGVRVVHRGTSGHAHATSFAAPDVRLAAEQAVDLARAAPGSGARPAGRPARLRDRPPARGHPRDASAADRRDLLGRAHRAAMATGLAHAQVYWSERWGHRILRTADGGDVDLEVLHTGLLVHAFAPAPGGGFATNLAEAGGPRGLRDYEGEAAPEALGASAGRWAREQAGARAAPAGRSTVLLDPVLAGALAHESFGHLAEADLVQAGWSALAGREGELLASEKVSLRDAGMVGEGREGVRVPADDEGIASREVALVREGRLAGFLHSRLTAAAAGAEPTGNARAVDARFAPICRMRNTYFAPGEASFEECVEAVGEGLYACGTSGGEARSDGTFLFKALRAYRIRGGKVAEPVREASLGGSILRTLREVDLVGDRLALSTSGFGGCGKWGQWPLARGYGGPHLVLRDALVGGSEAGHGS